MLFGLFGLCLAFSPIFANNSTGQFLHITDIHIDPNYDLNGDSKNWCHRSNENNNSPKLGLYGDHNCDSPMALFEFMLNETKAQVPNPDLIIWTGDTLPHDKYDENVLLDMLKKVTNAITSQFPNAILVPVLGNHDSAPGNSFTDHPAKQLIYENMFKMWEQWIGPEGKATFTRGGYYRVQTAANGLFLVLNTNIYYEWNSLKKEFVEPEDPSGQFDFLQFELETARQKRVPVHILGHVPPGAFEQYSWDENHMKQMPQKYNQRLVDLMVEYATEIRWMFFGHYHTDTFRVVKNSDGRTVQRFFTAPALTPAFHHNNPAFRVAEYNRNTLELDDMKTYFVHLNELNKNGANVTRTQLEYSMRDTFGGLDAQSLDAYIQKAKTNGTTFDALIRHNHVMYDANNWQLNATQRAFHLCALEFIDYERLEKCIANSDNSQFSAALRLTVNNSFTVPILVTLALILFHF